MTSQCVEEGDELNQVNFLVCWPTFGFAIKSFDCVNSVIRHFLYSGHVTDVFFHIILSISLVFVTNGVRSNILLCSIHL